MSDSEQTAEQINAFQKIWGETFVKLMQTTAIPGQQYPPPEMLRQMRGTVFQALTQSWDEFMRSPEFLQTMKKCMDQAIKFRKVSNDFMSRVRNEFQAPTSDDVEAVAFAVRGIEKRMDALAAELAEIKSAVSPTKKERSPRRSKPASDKTAKNGRKHSTGRMAVIAPRASATS